MVWIRARLHKKNAPGRQSFKPEFHPPSLGVSPEYLHQSRCSVVLGHSRQAGRNFTDTFLSQPDFDQIISGLEQAQRFGEMGKIRPNKTPRRTVFS
jgi:hypothetical protein